MAQTQSLVVLILTVDVVVQVKQIIVAQAQIKVVVKTLFNKTGVNVKIVSVVSRLLSAVVGIKLKVVALILTVDVVVQVQQIIVAIRRMDHAVMRRMQKMEDANAANANVVSDKKFDFCYTFLLICFF